MDEVFCGFGRTGKMFAFEHHHMVENAKGTSIVVHGWSSVMQWVAAKTWYLIDQGYQVLYYPSEELWDSIKGEVIPRFIQEFQVQPDFFETYDMLGCAANLGQTPLLLLYGEQDPLVPVAEGLKVYNAASGPKEVYTFPNTGHGHEQALNRVDKGVFIATMADVLERWF